MIPEVRDASYVNLATFRRDGREVQTPVWAAALDGKLYCFSEPRSGKVKRIRNSGRVKVAPCDARGQAKGEWISGQGRIVEDAALRKRIEQAMATKYGWIYRLLTILSKIGRKYSKRVFIELAV